MIQSNVMQWNFKCFLIGSTGYIGAPIINTLKKYGKIYGTSLDGRNGSMAFSLVAPDKFDYSLVVPGDIVLLAAAISAPDVCARDYNRAWAVNVAGTSNLIQRFIDCGARVIFFSSDTVYGEREDDFDETAQCNPAGEYAAMKFAVEQSFIANKLFKTIRLSYVFSRDDKFCRYLIGCVERKEVVDLFHPFLRAFVHRDDVVEGVLALAERWDEVPERIINFGGQQILSRVEFANCLREVYLHDLRFKVSEPDADFFKNRPRVISMLSPVFARLLGRQPRTLIEAARLEFVSSSHVERFS